MASWQGGHRHRAQPPPGCHNTGAAASLLALQQQGFGHGAGMWCSCPVHAGQEPCLCQKVQTAPLSRTHLCPWVFTLAIMQKLILRQRAPQISSLSFPELGLGSQQLHRAQVAWGALCSHTEKQGHGTG